MGESRKAEKEGYPKKQKKQKKRTSKKVGNWKMQEFGISQKWENVGNQKKKEIK